MTYYEWMGESFRWSQEMIFFIHGRISFRYFRMACIFGPCCGIFLFSRLWPIFLGFIFEWLVFLDHIVASSKSSFFSQYFGGLFFSVVFSVVIVFPSLFHSIVFFEFFILGFFLSLVLFCVLAVPLLFLFPFLSSVFFLFVLFCFLLYFYLGSFERYEVCHRLSLLLNKLDRSVPVENFFKIHLSLTWLFSVLIP